MRGNLHKKDVFVCPSPGSDSIPSEVEEFGGVCATRLLLQYICVLSGAAEEHVYVWDSSQQ